MSVTEFTVAGPDEGPYGVAVVKGQVWTTLVHAGVVVATDDGGCWITLWGAAAFARLDAAGNLIAQVGLGEGSEPHGLAVDADGSVWVALEKGSVAHIQP